MHILMSSRVVSWGLPGLGLALALAYWPGTRQFATMPRWCLLGTGAALLLWALPKAKLPSWLWALFAYAVLSVMWAPLSWDWANRIVQAVMLVSCFAIGTSAKAIESTMFWTSIGLAMSGVIATAELSGFTSVYLLQITVPSGLFGNRNILAETAMPLLAWACIRKRWGLAVPLALATFLPMSRSVMLSCAVTLAVYAWVEWRSRVGLVAIALVSGFIAWRWNIPGATEMRTAIWLDSLSEVPWWGHGFGQYYGLFPFHTFHIDTLTNRAEHAHNEWIELWFELGLPGLVCAGAGVWSLVSGPHRWQSYCLLALAIDSCFAFPLREPMLVFVAALLAGSLWAEHVRVRDRNSPFATSVAACAANG